MLTLAAFALAAAAELRVYVRAPDGSEGTAVAEVLGPVVLTRYPLPVGKRYTALVSATTEGSQCRIQIEIFQGDLRKQREVLSPTLFVTEGETSYLHKTTQADDEAKKAKPDWQVEARIETK